MNLICSDNITLFSNQECPSFFLFLVLLHSSRAPTHHTKLKALPGVELQPLSSTCSLSAANYTPNALTFSQYDFKVIRGSPTTTIRPILGNDKFPQTRRSDGNDDIPASQGANPNHLRWSGASTGTTWFWTAFIIQPLLTCFCPQILQLLRVIDVDYHFPP